MIRLPEPIDPPLRIIYPKFGRYIHVKGTIDHRAPGDLRSRRERRKRERKPK